MIPVTTKINGTANIIIYDAKGSLVQQFTQSIVAGKQNIEWKKGNIKSGTYTISVYMPDGAVKNRKVVKL